jgi:DNA helicase-2/ATP-dependent DNA helicase PcrA
MHLMRPDDFLMWLVRASGLQSWWRQSGDPQALRDWHRLMTLADRWQAAKPGLTVAGFTRRLRRHIAEYHAGREAGGQAEAVPVDETRDAVEVTTVHGAKGREWPTVFVADTALPSRRALQMERVLWDEHWKLVISGDETRPKKGVADPAGDLRRELRQRAIDEERAVWYVALTRARDRLIVTHSSCTLDEHGRFVDAAEALARPPAEAGSEAIHFFHELWELVRSQREHLGEAVFWGPGACSGVPAISPFSAQPARASVPPAEISPHIQAAWIRATASVDEG